MSIGAEAGAVLVGVDVGGTKTHLAVVDAGGRRDVVDPSERWRHGALFSEDGNLGRLAAWIRHHVAIDAHIRAVVGLRDADTEAELARARAVLAAELGIPVRVENDGELIAPAAGPEPAITMIVGTGSIVTAHDAVGRRLTAGGHGWLIGDWGGGPALVREALVRALPARDEGREDVLTGMLADALSDGDPAALASAATILPDPSTWSAAAPVVFAAAEAGSPIALAVIEDAAERLVRGATAVIARGAVGDRVVAAGGVVTRQARLRDAITSRLALLEPPVPLHLLQVPPVDGALRLAASGAGVGP